MKKYLIAFYGFLFLTSSIAQAQYSGILMDGNFTDWPAAAQVYNDPVGDEAEVDIQKVSFWHDSLNFYIRLKVNKEINLQESTITLYMDVDNNTSTGPSFNGMGVDFIYFFGLRRGVFNGATIYHNHVGHVSLPTHTSDEFELSFSRTKLPDNVNKLFPNETVKLIIREELENGDHFPDNGSFTYTLNNVSQPKYQPIDMERTDTSYLRLMNYNILRDGPMQTQKQNAFQRIMKATKPDIIAFNEFYNSTALDVRTLLNNTIPTGNTNGWYGVKYGLDLITLSKYPIKQSWLVLPGHNISATLVDLPTHFGKDILV